MIHNSWKHCPLKPGIEDVQQTEEGSEEGVASKFKLRLT